MRKPMPRKRAVTATRHAADRSLEVPEVVGKTPGPKPPAPAEPEPRVGAGMTEEDILDLVNNSYN